MTLCIGYPGVCFDTRLASQRRYEQDGGGRLRIPSTTSCRIGCYYSAVEDPRGHTAITSSSRSWVAKQIHKDAPFLVPRRARQPVDEPGIKGEEGTGFLVALESIKVEASGRNCDCLGCVTGFAAHGRCSADGCVDDMRVNGEDDEYVRCLHSVGDSCEKRLCGRWLLSNRILCSLSATRCCCSLDNRSKRDVMR